METWFDSKAKAILYAYRALTKDTRVEIQHEWDGTWKVTVWPREED